VQVVRGPTVVADYKYDAFGRRRQKNVNGTTTVFLYDGSNFVQEQAADGAVRANLLTGLGLDELYVRTLVAGSVTSNFLRDHLGTIIAEADGSGSVQTSYTYEPYGRTQQAGVASGNTQLYTAREQDTQDLYYYRARYYAPALGRFISEDPIGITGGTNLYTYAHANPLSNGDPLGLFCIPLPDETTAWQDYDKGKTYYYFLGAIFAEAGGAIGYCRFRKETTIFIKRQIRTRELCWECDNPSCGQQHCGFKMKYGEWRWQFSSRNDGENATVNAFRIYTGGSVKEGDFWWCNNPWTGERISGRM
jgi:RHS repeat-associated protein